MSRFDMGHWEFAECPEWRDLPHLRKQVKAVVPKSTGALYREVMCFTMTPEQRDLQPARMRNRYHKKMNHHMEKY